MLDLLEQLQRELTELGHEVELQADVPHPYLRVMHGYLAVEHVFVAWCDEPHYTWSNTTRTHPLNDPAAAARRIAADIVQRRETTTTTTFEGDP